jgi:hypothetical protein
VICYYVGVPADQVVIFQIIDFDIDCPPPPLPRPDLWLNSTPATRPAGAMSSVTVSGLDATSLNVECIDTDGRGD